MTDGFRQIGISIDDSGLLMVFGDGCVCMHARMCVCVCVSAYACACACVQMATLEDNREFKPVSTALLQRVQALFLMSGARGRAHAYTVRRVQV